MMKEMNYDRIARPSCKDTEQIRRNIFNREMGIAGIRSIIEFILSL